jgi:hypothetical protein
MKNLVFCLLSLYLMGCGKVDFAETKALEGANGKDGTSCTVVKDGKVTTVKCPDSETQVNDGNDGANGKDGVSVKGDKGDKGDTGAQGIQGIKGATGLQGPQGNTGPQGVAGAKGATGAQGIQGVAGPAGPQGSTGVNGKDGASLGFQTVVATADICPNGGTILYVWLDVNGDNAYTQNVDKNLKSIPMCQPKCSCKEDNDGDDHDHDHHEHHGDKEDCDKN